MLLIWRAYRPAPRLEPCARNPPDDRLRGNR